MKCRMGFVSNSSSSSFIIGYAVIKDKLKFEKYCTDNDIKWADVDSSIDPRYDDIKFFRNGFSIRKEDRILSRTNNKELIIPRCILDMWGDNSILTVEIGNDEGDSFFRGKYKFDDLDWEKAENIDFWTGYQRAVIDLFNRDDIIDIKRSEVIFGAERNG